MTTRLVQYQDSTYIDQYGVEHECERIIEEVFVTRTDEFIEWNYYDTQIQDYIWVSEDGRRFRAHSQTDFGPCDMPFSELETVESKRYYRFNPNQWTRGYGCGPIIDELEQPQPNENHEAAIELVKEYALAYDSWWGESGPSPDDGIFNKMIEARRAVLNLGRKLMEGEKQ